MTGIGEFIDRGRTGRDHPEPEDDAGLKVGDGPQDHAVGLPAGLSIAYQGMKHLGVTRSARTIPRINQAFGFDCPGCAWPEPADGAKTLEFCENGVKAVAEEATLRRATPEFFARHSAEDLAGRTGYWLGQQGRLTHPMHRAPGATHFSPIAWDDAYRLIADELRALSSPDEAIFYTSGRASNEAAYAYQLLARAYGTNNLPDCSNMCHESTSIALADAIGIGKGSVTINDLVFADLIIVAGQNPGTNHPRMLTTLEDAKARGARVMAINPLPEAGLERFDNPQKPSGYLGRGVQITDRHLQVKVGGDHALFRAFVHLTLKAEDEAPGSVLDHAFLDASVVGLDELRAEHAELDWALTEHVTGLTRAEIEAAAAELLAADKVVICWAMGLTQHRESVATIGEVSNLLLLRGQIGRTGAGLCPVRGHSNVQGNRTVGIWEQSPESFLAALDEEFGLQVPREHGFDVVNSIEAMRDGRAKVFMGLGGNFAAAAPDTPVTEEAFRGLRLAVHISTKLNRSHMLGRDGHVLILPTLGRTDRDEMPGAGGGDGGLLGDAAGIAGGAAIGVAEAVAHRVTGRRSTRWPGGDADVQRITVEDSMSVVHASHGHLDPPSKELRSEPRILTDLARELFAEGRPWAADGGSARAEAGRAIDWAAMASDYAVIRRHIERTVPGFDDYESRIRMPGGFVLPHPPRDSRSFPTADGKAHLAINPLEPIEVPEGHLILQTLRSHDQYNTTIYGLDDRYRGIKGGRRVVFVRPDDLAELGLADGDMVDLIADQFDGVERRADGFRVVSYPTARGCAAAYYPETNPLVPLRSTARRSNTPTSKSVIVRLVPAG